MATLLGNAYVRIRPDMDGFQTEANRSISTVLKSAAKVAAIAAGGALATVGVKVLKDSVAEASNLNESLNAVQVTFGKNAKGIMALGENAAKALGLSKTEFNGLAVRFSNFAQTVAGKGGDVVGTMDDLTTRASDFASVMNLDVGQAAELFQSGLAGETEPLRQYGIDLSAAAVQAHALAKGIWNGKGEMTEAQKVQARYSLLMKSTNKTAGDFANTSDSLANRQRIANAQWKNAKASIGQALLPVMQSVTAFIQEKVVPAIQTFGDWFTRDGMPALTRFGATLRDTVLPPLKAVVGWLVQNKDIILPIAGIIGTMVAAYKTWAFVSGIVTAAQTALNFALAANPIGLIVMAVAGLIAGLVLLFKKNETFRNVVLGAWEGIKNAITAVVEWLKPYLTAAWETIKAAVQAVWPVIQKIITVVWGAIKWWVEHYVKAVWTVITTVWDWIKTATQFAWDLIKGFVIDPIVAIWTKVNEVVGNLVTWVGARWDDIKRGTQIIWGKIRDHVIDPIVRAKNRVGEVVDNIGTKLSGVWDTIKTTAATAWTNVKDAIITPIKEVWGAIQSALGLNDDGGYTKKGPLGLLVDVWTKVKDGIGTAFSNLKDAIVEPIAEAFKWVNANVISKLNESVLSKFGDNVKIPLLPIPEGYATGGMVRGPGTGTSDSVLARLSNGEYVVNARATAQHRGLLEAINSGRGAAPSLAATNANWQPPNVGDMVSKLFKKGARAAINLVANPAMDYLENTFGSTFGGRLAVTGFRTMLESVRSWADDLSLAPTPLMEALASRFERMADDSTWVGVSTCLRNVNLALQALGQKFGFTVNGFATAQRAIDATRGVAAAGLMNHGDPPRGSLLFWDAGVGNSAGHIAVGDGKGNFMNNFGRAIVEKLPLDSARSGYRGWAYPWALIAGGKKYDSGGWLQPGWTATYNGTGKPEAILTSEQWDTLNSKRRGNSFHFEIHEAQPTTEDAILAAWRRADALYGGI